MSGQGSGGGKKGLLTLDAKRVSFLGRSAARDGGVRYVVTHEAQPTINPPEQRGDARRRTRLRSGKVVDIDNHFLTECFIHNRSTGGARLRLLQELRLPRVIKVYDDQTSTLVPAYVVWQRQGDSGIRFERHLDVVAARRAFMAALGDKFYAVPD